ncbi:MAG: hypothetical protein ACM3PE_09375 [Deltaproteobacteria bacterium]
MEKPWFDPETGILLLDEYVAESPSFIKIMEDGIVTPGEVMEQSQRVVELMKELEGKLDPATKELVTQVLSELCVLYAVSRKLHEKIL